uniref:Putative ovule protein n=1 Tax=Solanum chacoense TaxID=4108 RepID=A0A0V0H9A2_SOLCH
MRLGNSLYIKSSFKLTRLFISYVRVHYRNTTTVYFTNLDEKTLIFIILIIILRRMPHTQRFRTNLRLSDAFGIDD